MELAVNVGAVARPFVSVTAVFAPPAKVPLAPLAGAVKVTVTPGTPFPPLSFTVAVKAAKAVLIAALCELPEVTTMAAAAPAVFVNEKFAAIATPATLAVTV